MNALLIEIYSTVAPSAPYIIAAYAGLWAIMVGWLFVQYRKQDKLAKQLMLLEEAMEAQQK